MPPPNLQSGRRGVETTSLSQPFPSRLGLSLGTLWAVSPEPAPVLSMNWSHTRKIGQRNNVYLPTTYSPLRLVALPEEVVKNLVNKGEIEENQKQNLIENRL